MKIRQMKVRLFSPFCRGRTLPSNRKRPGKVRDKRVPLLTSSAGA
jgi:hypothetical protein